MRLIVTSDWHLDWRTDGFDRFEDIAEAVWLVVEEALRLPDTVFLFLGDLSNPYSRGVHRAVGFSVEIATELARADVWNFWLVGNHDVVEDAHGSHSLRALQGMHGNGRTFVLDIPRFANFCVAGKRKAILGLPFTSPKNSYDPSSVVDELSQQTCLNSRDVIVAGHLNLEGIGPGSETRDMARGREVFWPFATIEDRFPHALKLNGHYHEQMTYREVVIPGPLARLTHGEESIQPSFLVFEEV